ncbi:HupE/UreJ family protein [Sedimentitalea todarodis]|uniref:HupE/UreJ family protein n=1 Tax=Sedimentitalea todarodis TaxID=1631240 RepID=A0ABU3VKY1_9RHOB|nr:HupE/UreJ family protein [Sedimentitalea todarodis]MDU9006862.1 HupE/UreJ family protein [Sedimentitalea todarodis]
MIRSARWVFLILTGLMVAISTPVTAHDLGLAQVTVSSTSEGDIILRSKLSATLDAQSPVLPGTCTGVTTSMMAPDRLNQWLETRIQCQKENIGTILLPWQVDGVFLISQAAGHESKTRFVPAGPGGVSLDLSDLNFQERGTLGIASLYAQLGIKHILIGLDHLALLVCLVLLARGMLLVRLVTAFTIGHSITLCLAALQVVKVPVTPVEVLIVLSVAYLARDVWLGRSLDRNSTVLMGGIGLLHGLGFASVLSEIGLPKSDLLLALLSFNIGIEIGQLAFLTFVIVLSNLFGRVAPNYLVKLTPGAASFLTGSLAMYWTFERIAGFYV